MARARNIKPSFFTNDALGELDPIARLLFIGLWTIADFKGCIEYRSKRIKIQLLPYDNCDIDALTNNLERSGFISMYSVQGQRYMKIINFEKHQNPHKNERESGSDIPDIPENYIEIKDLQKVENNPEQNGTARAESLFPLPDSPSLIPDSLSSVDKSTGGKPPKLTDPKEIIFGFGLTLLMNAGTAEKQARSFLGGRVKEYEDGPVVDALRDCAKAKPLQPLEWLAAALPPKGAPKQQNKQIALEERNRAVGEQWLRDQETKDAPI